MRLRAATGTIDNPMTHNPQKQAPMTPSAFETTHHAAAAATRQNRTREMQLFPEALARAHVQERLYEAESERAARRVLTARRLQRRAERASLKARRALALVVMQ
ncbi:hypothetical protein K7472_05115 [Streptomyces sp. PTM05]|uniref:Uncharacterized protein n=1 Tax=Streptantibioticus parmotrematis TaxID=2873249 RepID=A0ABS7QM17_9ACTN|nr:hypothetical protein [Streptantibioticus parmotrematis]MBY8884226.1 hypothetical protein [Streptantibioticus parmotrematis]